MKNCHMFGISQKNWAKKHFFRPEKEHGLSPVFYSVHDTRLHYLIFNVSFARNFCMRIQVCSETIKKHCCLFRVEQQTSGLPMPGGKRLSHVPVSAAPLGRAAAAAATVLRLRLNNLLHSAQLSSTQLYSTLAALGSSQH